MDQCVIALEILCIIFSFLIFLGSAPGFHTTGQVSRSFTVCVVLNMLALTADLGSFAAEMFSWPPALIYTATAASFVMGYFLQLGMGFYYFYFIKERTKISIIHQRVMFGICLLCCFCMLGCMISGRMYTLNGSRLVADKLYTAVMLLPLLLFVYIFLMIIYFSNFIRRKELLVMLSYILLPLLCMILSLVLGGASLFYVASSVVIQTLYVSFQSQQREEFRFREGALIESNNTDTLTGLQNRRAYELFCESNRICSRTGVLFFDVNGLKYTNDNLGHKAGDELLNSFAKILKSNFSRENTYRISGDEFVVLLRAISEANFELKKNNVYFQLQSREIPYGAMGGYYIQSQPILEGVRIAEQYMYEDKQVFYEKHPAYIRK